MFRMNSGQFTNDLVFMVSSNQSSMLVRETCLETAFILRGNLHALVFRDFFLLPRQKARSVAGREFFERVLIAFRSVTS